MVIDPVSARQFLAVHSLSQADIARVMEEHRQTLTRYLKGERTAPDGFWSRFEEAGDKLRKSVLEDQDALIPFYERCHRPYCYFWPIAVPNS